MKLLLFNFFFNFSLSTLLCGSDIAFIKSFSFKTKFTGFKLVTSSSFGCSEFIWTLHREVLELELELEKNAVTEINSAVTT